LLTATPTNWNCEFASITKIVTTKFTNRLKCQL